MRVIGVMLWLALGAGCVGAAPMTLEQQRQGFVDARELQRQQRWNEYEALRSKLDTYPLAAYLDYYGYRERLDNVSPERMRKFAEGNPGLPLVQTLRKTYLDHLGKSARWQQFLQVSPTPPRPVALQCYYYQAKLAQGQSLEAFEGARRLWLHGHSRPDECDPLFASWRQSSNFTKEDTWQRLELAFAAGQGALLNYLRKQLPEPLQADGALLAEVFANPALLQQAERFRGASPRLPAIVASGLERMARREPEQALELWQAYQQQPVLANERAARLETILAQRLLLAEAQGEAGAWRDRWLVSHGSVDMLDQRIRLALENRDWNGLLTWIGRYEQLETLPGSWIYWREQGQRQLGGSPGPSAAYLQLAEERSYYGFLAASELDGPYRLERARPQVDAGLLDRIGDLPVIARIDELHYQDRMSQARAEWLQLIREQTPQQLLALAEFANRRQWHYYAILATIEGRMWDHLDYRFPMPWEQEVAHFASSRKLPRSLLYAVARQESALNPRARSHVGARGLMQLMPATARQTAREIGFGYQSLDQLYQPEVNIRLGSAYLSSLLERYQGNRIMAIAAYNAGPHRVDRWLGSARPDSMAAWVETIPFRETRGYVQNVLAFNVIYQSLLGEQAELLTARDLSYNG